MLLDRRPRPPGPRPREGHLRDRGAARRQQRDARQHRGDPQVQRSALHGARQRLRNSSASPAPPRRMARPTAPKRARPRPLRGRPHWSARRRRHRSHSRRSRRAAFGRSRAPSRRPRGARPGSPPAAAPRPISSATAPVATARTTPSSGSYDVSTATVPGAAPASTHARSASRTISTPPPDPRRCPASSQLARRPGRSARRGRSLLRWRRAPRGARGEPPACRAPRQLGHERSAGPRGPRLAPRDPDRAIPLRPRRPRDLRERAVEHGTSRVLGSEVRPSIAQRLKPASAAAREP